MRPRLLLFCLLLLLSACLNQDGRQESFPSLPAAAPTDPPPPAPTGPTRLSLPLIAVAAPRDAAVVTTPTALPLAEPTLAPASLVPALPTAAAVATVSATPEMPAATSTAVLPASLESPAAAFQKEIPAVATPCPLSGRTVSATLASAFAGPLAYNVFLPPCYGQDGRLYPALYMLPGSNQDENSWRSLGLDAAADQAIQAGSIPPFIIVTPAGGDLYMNTSGGYGSYETAILDELIPAVEATYCAWPEAAGRAIGGLSRGGYWALEIAFRFPEHFAGAGGHSPALVDIAAGPDINPLTTGATRPLGDLRVYLDTGVDDYLIQNTLALHYDMTAAAVAHEWRLNEGRHEDAYWSANAASYLDWYASLWPGDRSAYAECPLPQAPAGG